MKRTLIWVCVALMTITLCSCGNKPVQNTDFQIQTELKQLSEEEYIDFIMDWFDRQQTAFNALSGVNMRVTIDKSLVHDDGWKNDVRKEALKMKSICSEMIDYNETLVPDKMKETHGYLVLASVYNDKGMDALIKGVENTDSDEMTKAGEYNTLGMEYILKAAKSLPNKS